MLGNPVYAGAYVYGKSESRTVIVGGQARRTANNPKPREQWSIVILGHHPGYISWEQYERNHKLMAENNYVRSAEGRKAGRGGNSLLTGVAAVWPLWSDDACRLRWEKSRDRAISLYRSQRLRAHEDLPGVCRRPAG